MSQDRNRNLLDVQKYMPAKAAAAVQYFVELNPKFQGAEWADILDGLDESDSHLEIVEPMWEECQPYVMIDESPLVRLVTYTLTYAHNGAPPYMQQVLYWIGYIAGRREKDAQAD